MSRLGLDGRDIGLLPGVLALALFGVWAAEGGAFAPTVWYPGGLLLLALLAVAVLGLGDRVVMPARTVVPLTLLAAFTAWSYLSMIWAGGPATAWDGANRTAIYLVVFGLFSAFEWRSLGAGLWVGLFVLTVAVVAATDLVSAMQTGNPGSYFISGRYTGPTEYPNASACLFLMGAWPAVVIGAQRAVPWVVRALLVTTAAFLTELALLTESRGAVLAAIATGLILLVVVPDRIRTLVAVAGVALTVVVARGPLLDVYRVVVAHGNKHSALVRAGHAMLWSCAALLVVALASAFVDSRWTMSTRQAFLTRRAVGTLLVAAACTLVAVGVLTTDAAAKARRGWHDFTGIPKPYGVGLGNPSSHFEADPLSGNRYDVWRVSWRQFTRAPANGAGADNFAVDYLQQRRSDEEPEYPFSIELRALGQTGIVGAALLLGFLVSCGVVVLRPRRGGGGAAVSAAAATLVATQWLAHGSVDILWEMPALAAPAFAALAIALRVSDHAPGPSARPASRGPGRRLALTAPVLLVTCGLAASFVFPWLAAADVRAAEGAWRTDAPGAASKLARARGLNPLSDDPDVVAGAIASRRRRWPEMRAAFRRALQRNDLAWYSWFELGVVDAYTNRRAPALAELRRAQRLDPREWTIGFVRYRLRIHKPLAPAQLDRIFRIRYEAQVAPAPPRKP